MSGYIMAQPRTYRWEKAAKLRRVVISCLIALTTIIASAYMADILPLRGGTIVELIIVIIFAALFAWISIGFWEAMAGVITLLKQRDRFAITDNADTTTMPEGAEARTAILIPICNEDVDRVFAGLRATYESVSKTGYLDHFDFFEPLGDSRLAELRVAVSTAQWVD